MMKLKKHIKNYGRKIIIGFLMMVFSLQNVLVFVPQKAPVYAATNTINTQTDFTAGKYEYGEIDALSSPGDIKLQSDLGTWEASGPANLNHYAYTNTKAIKIGNFVYVFRNRYIGQFLRLDLSTNEWKEMQYVPIEPYEVVDATSNGVDTIWAFATRSGREHFMKYDIPTDTWTMLDTTMLPLSVGSTLEYVPGTPPTIPNYIYAFQGGNNTVFWRYNISSNSWSQVGNTTATCGSYCDLLFDNSQYLYLATDNGNPDRFMRYNPYTGGSWTSVGNFPIDAAMNYGSDVVKRGNTFYAMRSGGTQTFYKYSGGVWTAVKPVPFVTTYGSLVDDTDTTVSANANAPVLAIGGIGELAYYYPETNTWSNGLTGPPANAYGTAQNLVPDGNGNLYMCRGQNTTTCYKYTVSNDTWSTLAVAPIALGTSYGPALAYATSSAALYASRGNSSANFYRYNPAPTNTWTTTLTNSPVVFGDGSALIASGSGTSASIWGVSGAGGTGWYRYDITGNAWSAAKKAVPEPVSRGSGLVQAGMYSYLLNGGSRGKFFRYHETTNGWEELPTLPIGSYNGGGLTYDGGDYIYAMVGGDNNIWARRMYRYSISGRTWTRMTDAPAMMRYGGSIGYYGGKLYAYQGYGGSFWRYNPPVQTYKTTGTWYSDIIDNTFVSVWGNFEATDEVTGSTSVTYYTRTSDNKNIWDDWVLATKDSQIESTNRRYIQVKAVLTGDGSTTPTVSQIGINYTGDTTAPDISGIAVTGKSQKTNGTNITTPGTYAHTNPYFSWSGVADSESGVNGYYVYFGSQSDGNPITLGNFQNTTDYVVTSPMVSGTTYYLRIAPKNNGGTTPVATTHFAYTYNGISPASTTTVATLQSDWDNDEATKSGTAAQSSAWWDEAYQYRRQLTLSPSLIATAGSMVKVTLDTDVLVTAQKLREDRKDWRIVFNDGVHWKEVDRQYVNSTLTYFPLQRGINGGSTDTNYYLYYGNPNVRDDAPSNIENSNAGAKWGAAGWFGGDDYIRIPNLINGKSQITIEGWFKYFNSAAARYIYGDASSRVAIYVTSGQNYLSYNFRANSTVTGAVGTTQLVPGTWNHVAMVYDSTSSSLKTYVNGRLDYTNTTMTGVINTGTSQQYLGGPTVFYGMLDESRISSSLRYTNSFTIPVVPFIEDENTLALYHFNEGAGQTLVDSSSNNNHGTLGSLAGVDANDPGFTGYTAATEGSESERPSVSDDTSLSLESLTNGSWAGYQVGSLPYGLRMATGTSLYINNSLYIFRGRDTRIFYKKDLATGVWTQLADIPAGANSYGTYYGTAMAYDGDDTIYVLKGRATSEFYKYTISTNTWSADIDQPIPTFTSGASMVRVGNMFYVTQGGSTAMLGFNKDYESKTDGVDAWSNMQPAPNSVGYGGGLVYDGNNTLWLVSGGGVGLSKYTISGEGGNTWNTSVTAPALAPYYIGYSTNNAIFRNNYVYTFTSYDFQSNGDAKRLIWRYNTLTDKWDSIPNETEFWSYYGSIAYDGSRYAYLTQGIDTGVQGNTAMVRYDLETNTFTPGTPPLPLDRTYENDGTTVTHAPYTGTSMAYDGSDYLYMIQGNSTSATYTNRYQISKKKWTMLPIIPCNFAGGIVYASNKLYAFCGNGTKKAYSFDPLTFDWTMLADSPGPGTETITSAGNQIAVWDSDDTIYVLRGGGSTTLYKYIISTNTWSTESTAIPGSIGNNWGASITYDGSQYLYISRGNGTNNFYRYKITTPTGWTTMASLPENVSYGSGSVYHDGKVYVTSGYQNNSLYLYDVLTDAWIIGPQAPSQIYAGGTMVKGPEDSVYVLEGNYMSTFWKFNLPSTSSSYVYTGSYISKPIDLGTAYSYAGLDATVASPSATSISFETRTSTDAAHWSDWALSTDLKQNPGNHFSYTINSPIKRFIQTRITMNSDESVSSPTVSDISVIHYSDETAPTNPNTLSAYTTASKTASLSDGVWKNYNHPYFEWSGASDGTGSGISGYYVYFDTDPDADASLSGQFITTASYSATLNTDGNYYLKIKTVDKAGNISPTHYAPFHYMYDGTAPSTISTENISVLPNGYTATNYFTFSWTATEDPLENGTASGLLRYEYKTGTNSGALSEYQPYTGTCSGGVCSLAGITAYKEDINTFYLRTVDTAGNISAVTSGVYSYNTMAPSAPRNLEVDTSQAAANKFSFTWDAPQTYRGTIKEYRYSINEPPNSANISTTSARIVNNIRGVHDGNNTFFVVAVDDANNVSYLHYVSKVFSVSVSAPGIPLAPEAFDNSIRSTKQYRVGLTWDPPTDKGTAFDRYEVYASSTSTECSTEMAGYTLAGSTAGTSYVVTSIGEDALESKDYYFCVVACATTNQCSSASTTVTMKPSGRWLTAPEMTGSQSATVKTKSALVTWTTNRAANSFVKYGTKSGDYASEVGSSEQDAFHSINITGLNPGTKYYYKLLWTDEDGNQGESEEMDLSTNPAPFVSGVKATDVSIRSAYVTFTSKNGIKATIQYGKTLSYGGTVSTSVSKSETTSMLKLDNLVEGTAYHYRIVVEDDEGNTFAGDDYTFETLPIPKILGLKVQQVSGMSTATVRLIWTSNTPISSIVTYYPTDVPSEARDQISLSLKKSHEVILKNLKDDMDYTIVVKGRDTAGNEAVYPSQKVKTAVDFRPPELLNLNVESTIIGVGDDAKAQIIISWDTDEPASTQVEYAQGTGTTYGQTTQEDTNLTTNHVVTIPGLSPSKIYHLRAVSKDKANNISQSDDTVTITPKSTKDALNLVIDNMSKTFGFLKSIQK